jgi:hypothetical protein
MDDPDALHGGGEVVPLRPKTIDDGEIRLGPARLAPPLSATQEAQAVELLTALFAAALRRQRSSTRLRRAA